MNTSGSFELQTFTFHVCAGELPFVRLHQLELITEVLMKAGVQS